MPLSVVAVAADAVGWACHRSWGSAQRLYGGSEPGEMTVTGVRAGLYPVWWRGEGAAAATVHVAGALTSARRTAGRSVAVQQCCCSTAGGCVHVGAVQNLESEDPGMGQRRKSANDCT